MDERVVTQQQLEQLLRETEQAHAQYERSLGHADDNWPAWYAAHMFQQLQPVKQDE